MPPRTARAWFQAAPDLTRGAQALVVLREVQSEQARSPHRTDPPAHRRCSPHAGGRAFSAGPDIRLACFSISAAGSTPSRIQRGCTSANAFSSSPPPAQDEHPGILGSSLRQKQRADHSVQVGETQHEPQWTFGIAQQLPGPRRAPATRSWQRLTSHALSPVDGIRRGASGAGGSRRSYCRQHLAQVRGSRYLRIAVEGSSIDGLLDEGTPVPPSAELPISGHLASCHL